MGQTICGGARADPKQTLDLSIFDNSKHFCTIRKGSPYYKKKIKKAERKAKNAKLLYEEYKQSKLRHTIESEFCNNKRIRSNSN